MSGFMSFTFVCVHAKRVLTDKQLMWLKHPNESIMKWWYKKTTISMKICFCGFEHLYFLSLLSYGNNICDHADLHV